MQDNLWSTVNLLEKCKNMSSGFVLLSTSRVYSVPQLRKIPLGDENEILRPVRPSESCTPDGIKESFSTRPPLSLYGASKLTSEVLSLEYHFSFGLPVWVNRCGLMAGAGQFGKPDQGIVSFWIHSWLRRSALSYTGFDGIGLQTRDCMHPSDLALLLEAQFADDSRSPRRIFNVSGGASSSFSLAQLSRWCSSELGEMPVGSVRRESDVDVPWLVLDCARAKKRWGWKPRKTTAEIFAEVANHARQNPSWLDECA